MSDLEKKLSELQSFYDLEFFIVSTYAQVIKDLAHLYTPSNKKENFTKMSSLVEYFSPIFKSLLENKKHELVQFLYRADIAENSVAHSLEEKDIQAAAIKLTRVILDRELKKVIIRKHYSSES